MLLCKTAGLCHCNSTHEDLPSIQVCRYTTLMRCSTGFGKNGVLLPMLLCKVAGLGHCNYTYRELLSQTGKQSSNTNALQHWIWLQVHPTAQCCPAKQAHSRLVSLQLHLLRFALHTGVQSNNTNALQLWIWLQVRLNAQCCCAQQQAGVTAAAHMQMSPSEVSDDACLLPKAVLYLYKCWVNAHLYEDQIPTGENTLTQPCYRHVLHSSSEQWVWLPRAKLQCTGAGSLPTCTKIKSFQVKFH